MLDLLLRLALEGRGRGGGTIIIVGLFQALGLQTESARSASIVGGGGTTKGLEVGVVGIVRWAATALAETGAVFEGDSTDVLGGRCEGGIACAGLWCGSRPTATPAEDARRGSGGGGGLMNLGIQDHLLEGVHLPEEVVLFGVMLVDDLLELGPMPLFQIELLLGTGRLDGVELLDDIGQLGLEEGGGDGRTGTGSCCRVTDASAGANLGLEGGGRALAVNASARAAYSAGRTIGGVRVVGGRSGVAGPLFVEILVKGFDLELHAYVLADLLTEGSAGPIQIPAGHPDGFSSMSTLRSLRWSCSLVALSSEMVAASFSVRSDTMVCKSSICRP